MPARVPVGRIMSAVMGRIVGSVFVVAGRLRMFLGQSRHRRHADQRQQQTRGG
jgi:hypothetical protein